MENVINLFTPYEFLNAILFTSVVRILIGAVTQKAPTVNSGRWHCTRLLVIPTWAISCIPRQRVTVIRRSQEPIMSIVWCPFQSPWSTRCTTIEVWVQSTHVRAASAAVDYWHGSNTSRTEHKKKTKKTMKLTITNHKQMQWAAAASSITLICYLWLVHNL